MIKSHRVQRWIVGIAKFQRAWRVRLGAPLLGVFIILALTGPRIAQKDPTAMDIGQRLLPPGLAHPFGTDQFGRDLLTRVVHGTRISLQTGVVAVSVALTLGVPMGFLAGFYGGAADRILTLVVDFMLAFPGILLALLIVAILGPSLLNAMIAVGVSSSPAYARVVRSSVLVSRSLAYVEAARAVGCTNGRIMARHIMPNTMAPIIVVATLGVASAIVSAAALSFLGLGAQPPSPEWGAILSEGRNFLHTAWWISTFPGLMIITAVFAINLLGDALRDLYDPKL